MAMNPINPWLGKRKDKKCDYVLLSPGEIKKLKNHGHEPHDLKPKSSQDDLYKCKGSGKVEAMGKLAESLIRRKAILPVRLDFFRKPEMNIGGHRKKSHADAFEEHGTTGKAALRNPSFAQYLRYFIFGPDLPDDTIQRFRKIIDDDDDDTEGELLDQITAFVRSEVRQKRLNGQHEEFFKLAHELEKPEWAEHVRKAAMNVR